jgi:RNA polymerase sigma factor (sigma-70 family)
MPAFTDLELWRLAQDGDRASFGEIYERHARSVQAFCLWRTAERQLAEDVTSTVFLEAWRLRGKLQLTTASARPLLLGVATNVLRNHWRSRRRHDRAVERIRGAEPTHSPGHEDEVVAGIDALRQVQRAGAAIRALPAREREVLALLAWGELTYAETAAALGIPIGTVRSRVSRARARLGDSFLDHAPSTTPVEDPPR